MKLYQSVLIALIATALISCGGAEERKAVYLEKAKVSIAKGDYDKARIELKNVLQIDPKDAVAYYQLGKVHQELENYQKAYANYLKAEELDPELLENQAKIGNVYLYLIKDIDKTQEKVDLILRQDPDNSDGLLLKAGILVQQGLHDEAIKIIEDINKRDPGHVDAASLLSSLYNTKNRHLEAIDVLDKALALNEGNVRLTKLLAYSLMKDKDYQRAEEIFKSNLEKNPDLRASYRSLAAFYNESGDKNQAEKMLRNSIDNDPEDVERYFDLIKYISVKSSNKSAIEELRRFIDKKPGLGKLRIALAEYLYLNDKHDEAINIYKSAIKDFSEEVTGVSARMALATIYLKDNDIEKANQVIEEAIEISPNNPQANLYRAKVALKNNDLEKAIIALRIVTNETPENIEAYMLLVNAYQLDGQNEQAQQTLDAVYEKNKLNPQGLLVLSRYYLNRDIKQAEKVIDRYNQMKEEDYSGLSVKVAILNQNKKYKEAYDLSVLLADKFPQNQNGYLYVLPYLLQQDDRKEAISILEKGYINSKENKKILETLSALQASEGQYDLAEKRILIELNKKPDDASLKVLLAKIYLADKKLDKAESLLNDVVDSGYKSEEPYLLLADLVSARSKDALAGKPTLLEGKKNIPASIKIALRLASVYEAEKQYDKAISLYDELLEIHPNNLIIINNLVSLMSDYRPKSELEPLLAMTNKLVESDRPVFLDTVGWLYYKLGDYNMAIELLQKAVLKAPDVSVFNFHFGMAYKDSGDVVNARTYLQKSLSGDSKFKERAAAESALNEL